LSVNGKISTYYFDFTYKPIFDEKGKIYGIMDMAVDVTELVRAQQNAEAADIALRSAIDITNLDTWEIDPNSSVISYSGKIQQWIGSENTSLPIEDFIMLTDPKDQENMREAFLNLQSSRWRKQYSIEFAVTNRTTGIKKFLHSRGKAIFTKEGVPIKIIGITQDITKETDTRQSLEDLVRTRTKELAASNEELVATNQKLRVAIEEVSKINNTLTQSNQELEQYAYAASHDLQEPLRKIQTFTDFLNTDNTLNERSRTFALKINASAGRMTRLIQDLLAYSRLQPSGISYEPVDLNLVLKGIIRDLDIAIDDIGAKINVDELPVIDGIPVQLTQLFFNLLSNGLKFRAENRTAVINVSARRAEMHLDTVPDLINGVQYFDITVKDNGIGFSQEYSKQIFEIFRRLHAWTDYPGSGIGLALCKRIAANHHGYITVESSEGEGSSFHILLPEKQFTAI
jgi:PAS domain S-box-containing protein